MCAASIICKRIFNYRSDITLIPLRKQKYLEIFVTEIELHTLKRRKIELRFFEIPPNSKQISNTLESENIGPVYELFKILWYVCVKETSPRDVAFKAVAIDSRLSQGIQWLLTAGCHQRIRYCQPAVTSEFAADSQ